MPTKTQKVLVGSALAIVVILGLTPKVIGLGIRDATITNLVDLLPPETRSQLVISENEFNSGWFSSSAVLDVSYAAFGADVVSLQLEFEISHGPLLFTPGGFAFGLAHAEIRPRFDNQALSSALRELPFELPAIEIELLARFDRSLRIGWTVSPVNYSDNQALLAFEGLHGSLTANADQSAEILLSMGRLQAQETSSNVGFTLAGIEIVSTTEQLNNALAPSNALLQIPSLSSDAPYPFLVTEISANSRIQVSAAGPEQVDIYQDLKIANIESEFPLASLSWSSEIKELHSDLFDRYYQLLSDLQNQISASPGTVNTQVNQLGQELALTMIQNSLVFNNTIEANAYAGDHSVDLQIDWQGLPELDNVARLDINQALDALNISLEMSLDLAAVMRSPAAELVDSYVLEGYIVIDNGRILLSATLSDSELLVNGDVVAIDELF